MLLDLPTRFFLLDFLMQQILCCALPVGTIQDQRPHMRSFLLRFFRHRCNGRLQVRFLGTRFGDAVHVRLDFISSNRGRYQIATPSTDFATYDSLERGVGLFHINQSVVLLFSAKKLHPSPVHRGRTTIICRKRVPAYRPTRKTSTAQPQRVVAEKSNIGTAIVIAGLVRDIVTLLRMTTHACPACARQTRALFNAAPNDSQGASQVVFGPRQGSPP